MKSLKFMAILAALGGYLIPLILLEGSNLTAGGHFTFALFGIFIGLTIYSPLIPQRPKTKDGLIAGVGVSTSQALLALIFSFTAVLCWFNNKYAFGYALDVVAIIMGLFSFGFSNIVTNHVDGFTIQNNFKSDHLIWRSELSMIRSCCRNSEIERSIAELVELATYLSKDRDKNKLNINTKINEAIVLLRESASTTNKEEVISICEKVKSLFKQRELEMANSFF